MRRSVLLGLSCVVPLFTLQCGSSGDTAFTPGHPYEAGVGGSSGDSGLKDGQVKDSPGDHVIVVDDSGDAVSEPVGPPPCTAGLIDCKNNQKTVCQPDGTWGPGEDCGTKVCSNLLGCVTCLPGTGTCTDANTAHTCLNDGSGFLDETCDPDLGSTCDANSGACTGACAPSSLGKGYIGCEYYASVTVNSQLANGEANFAVAVSNTTTSDATVKIFTGGAPINTVTVGANSVAVINLPWNALKTTTSTAAFPGAGYHLKSTQPVTVYQFNPLEYATGSGSTYTNDASLLIPVTAWGMKYLVASRNTWQWSGFSIHGFYAVIASQDGTNVTVTPSATGGNMIAGAGIAANGAGTITLNAGDVVQVQSADTPAADPTGTYLESDKPIEVIGGHDCTFIPATIGYCDHIEEVMFPANSLSTEYLVTPPSLPGLAQPKPFFVRPIALEAGTTLEYDPPNGAWPASLNNAGDYVEIDSGASFKITSNKKILVSQYMKGQDAGGGSGDPAMALAVTTQQFRKDYLFHSPVNYETNYVNIIAQSNATVTLDGQPVQIAEPIGSTGYGVARVNFPNGGNGDHNVSSTTHIGITVYGYGQYTSYWYPGGLNLTDL